MDTLEAVEGALCSDSRGMFTLLRDEDVEEACSLSPLVHWLVKSMLIVDFCRFVPKLW